MKRMQFFYALPLALVILVFTSMAPLSAIEEDPCFCKTEVTFQTFQLQGCKVGILATINTLPAGTSVGTPAQCVVLDAEWTANNGATIVPIGSGFTAAALEAPGPGTYKVCLKLGVYGLDGSCQEEFCIDVQVDC